MDYKISFEISILDIRVQYFKSSNYLKMYCYFLYVEAVCICSKKTKIFLPWGFAPKYMTRSRETPK